MVFGVIVVFNIATDGETTRRCLMLLTREQEAELGFDSVQDTAVRRVTCFFRILDGSSHKACHPALLVKGSDTDELCSV